MARGELLLWLLSPLFIAGSTHAIVGVETVALSGDPAPGTPAGVEFSSFEFFTGLGDFDDGPLMSRTGEVAFVALLSGPDISVTNEVGIWAETPGGLALVARAGDPAPGKPGRAFNRFGTYPVWGPNGTLGVTGETVNAPPNPPDGNRAAIWLGAPGSLELLFHQNDAVPGTSETYLSGRVSDLNAAGELGVIAHLSDSLDRLLVWSPPVPPALEASIRTVALQGEIAPGSSAAFERFPGFFSPTPYPLHLADDGSAAFEATLEAPDFSVGLWQEGLSGLELVALEGEPAPDTGDGVFPDTFFDVNQSKSGVLSVFSFINGGSVVSGFFSADPASGFALDIANSDPAPGGGTLFFFQPSPAPVRGAGIRAFIAGSSPNRDDVVYLGEPNNLRELLRIGDQPPGATPGATYSIGSSSTRRLVIDLNAAGEVGLLIELQAAAGDLGIFMADANEALQAVALKGEPLEVAPGDSRIVSDLGMIATSETPFRALSETGDLAFRAEFTNGTAGVFVATLPEPGLGTSLGSGLLLLGVLRARSRGSKVFRSTCDHT